MTLLTSTTRPRSSSFGVPWISVPSLCEYSDLEDQAICVCSHLLDLNIVILWFSWLRERGHVCVFAPDWSCFHSCAVLLTMRTRQHVCFCVSWTWDSWWYDYQDLEISARFEFVYPVDLRISFVIVLTSRTGSCVCVLMELGVMIIRFLYHGNEATCVFVLYVNQFYCSVFFLTSRTSSYACGCISWLRLNSCLSVLIFV